MRTRNTDKEELVKRKAIQMIVADGYEGFSMNKLAKACDISVATLYIYYKDKDDLIRTLGLELSKQFISSTLRDFSADMPFPQGLRQQWENRSRYALDNPEGVACYEILRHSQFGDFIYEEGMKDFKETMGAFFHNAVNNGELVPIESIESFWCVAYGPLYMLLRFHKEGKSMGATPFVLSQQTIDATFNLVIKALTP